MNIPFTLIPDILADLKPRLIGDIPICGEFNWVESISGEDTFDSGQIVYVADAEYIVLNGVPEGHVCICSSKKKGTRLPKSTDGCTVLLGENVSSGAVVKRIRTYILSIQEWESAMSEAILKKDMGLLFSCSERILGNSILFFTQRYKLLDFVGDIPWDDPAYRGYLDDIDQSDAISLTHPAPKKIDEGAHNAADHLAMQNYPLIKRTIEVNGHPINYLIMLCNNFPPTDGRVRLFDLFAERLKVFIDIDTPTDSFEHSVESFIFDLIENKITDIHAITNRAMYCKLPFEKLYSLFVVRFTTYNEIRAIGLMNSLASMLPDAKLSLFYDKIIIINYFRERVVYRQILDWIDRIKDLLRENHAELGISQPEKTIDKLSRSYMNAIEALHYGRRVRDHRITEPFDDKDINSYQGYDIFMYENYYVYHMIDLLSNQNSLILENSYCIQSLVWLYELDKATKLDNVRLLYCYLANDGSASKTAAHLHMHRNNVVYRISRIEEYLGMDLRENHLRFKFMFAYRVLDFYGIEYLENVDLVLFGGTKSPPKQTPPERGLRHE